MTQDPSSDPRLFDERDQAEPPPAPRARQHVKPETALHQLRPQQTPRCVEPLIDTAANERDGIVSPNGHWLVYESDFSGSFEICVRPYPNSKTGQEWKISTAGGMKPLWARNGRELFYVAPDGSLMGVPVDASDAAWSGGPLPGSWTGRT
jgi:hypothetical protein